jgi:hypothetical protein
VEAIDGEVVGDLGVVVTADVEDGGGVAVWLLECVAGFEVGRRDD